MFLFLVRRFNDIDHMVPIAYRMAKDGEADIRFISLTPSLHLKSNFLLNFLKDEFRIPSQHYYDCYSPTFLHKFAAWIINRPFLADRNLIEKRLYSRLILRINNFIAKFLSPRVLKLAKLFLFTKNWSVKAVHVLNPSVLIVDWQQPEKSGDLLHACREMGVPVVSVPHGINLVKNENFIFAKGKKEVRLPSDYGILTDNFDHIIVNSDPYRWFIIKHGADPKKVAVIGSTRFCEEWERVYKKILPSVDIQPSLPTNSSKKLKVVFMDHSAAYRIIPDNVLGTVKKMLDRDDINLIIKPSTGSLGTVHKSYQKLSSEELIRLAPIANDVSSLSLIQWADVVICVTSSICIEVLMHNKIFLYPKYFHDNEMIFDEMKACWTLNNDEELSAAIDSIKRDPSWRPYRDEDVKKFIEIIVYGGHVNRDVLGEYVSFILEKSHEVQVIPESTRLKTYVA